MWWYKGYRVIFETWFYRVLQPMSWCNVLWVTQHFLPFHCSFSVRTYQNVVNWLYVEPSYFIDFMTTNVPNIHDVDIDFDTNRRLIANRYRKLSICRIKTGSGGVCCPNARGRVRNRKSNPDGVAGGIWRTVRTSPSALWQQTPTDRS